MRQGGRECYGTLSTVCFFFSNCKFENHSSGCLFCNGADKILVKELAPTSSVPPTFPPSTAVSWVLHFSHYFPFQWLAKSLEWVATTYGVLNEINAWHLTKKDRMFNRFYEFSMLLVHFFRGRRQWGAGWAKKDKESPDYLLWHLRPLSDFVLAWESLGYGLHWNKCLLCSMAKERKKKEGE